MASPKGIDGNADGNVKFPVVDAEGELNPRKTRDFPEDPISSNVSNSKDLKEPAAEATEDEENKKMEKLKSMFIMSGVALVVIAAIFAITKKLREK